MSDTPDQDPDLLAAEYALGALDGAERDAARGRAEADPAFGRAVEAWNRRLAPLSRLTEDDDPPPDLWARIAASTSTARSSPFQHRAGRCASGSRAPRRPWPSRRGSPLSSWCARRRRERSRS